MKVPANIILLFTLFVCSFTIGVCNAQDKLTDSLTRVLKASKDDSVKVNTLNTISLDFAGRNDFNKAMSYAREGLALAQKINYKRGIVTSYNSLSIVYGALGNDVEALNSLFTALKEVEESGNSAPVAIAYSNIGGFYLGHASYPDALKNFQASLKVSEALQNNGYMASCLLNIGVVYQLQGNLNEALKSYLASLRIKEKTSDKLSISNSLINIGNLYMKLGKWEEAREYMNKGLEIAREANSLGGIAASYINLGELNMHLQKMTEARDYLNKGLQLSKEIKTKDYIKETYYHLSHLDSMAGDSKGAYQNYKLYTLMKDSIRDEESEKLISQLKIRYETEKKDKDIELKSVKIQNQETFIMYLVIFFIALILFVLIYSRVNAQKRKSVFRHQILETEMKALRSQMNPHFTFNVLNSIQYFINENDTESAEMYIEKFSSLIRMILDQSRTAYITLEQEATILKLYLELEEMRFEKKFNYSININGNVNPGTILIPGMLMQPIVENAIKHGIEFKEGNAMITISFSVRGSVLVCSVTDNGIGRAQAEKLTKGKGYKSAATSIIRERMDALSSIYNIRLSYKTEDLTNEEGKPEGTCVTLEVPIGIKEPVQE